MIRWDVALAQPSDPRIRWIPSIVAAVIRPVSCWPAELTKPTVRASVEQKPAASVSRLSPMKACTNEARAPGPASAVASCQWSTAGAAARGASPGQSGSGGLTLAASMVEVTSLRTPSTSLWVVVAAANRPSTTVCKRTSICCSAMF